MFNNWNKIDELSKANKILLLSIVVMLVTNIFLSIGLYQAPNKVKIFVTPSLVSQGGEVSKNVVPKSSIYSFVSTLFPMINMWSGDDTNEHLITLHKYKNYLSPLYFRESIEQEKNMKLLGFLKNEQIASLYQSLDDDNVEEIGPNKWSVLIKLRLTQRLNNTSKLVISDKVILYKVRVSRVSYSKELNPFELVIDGYVEPEKLSLNLLEKEEVNNE